jgi:S1-C subfamily serine protease
MKRVFPLIVLAALMLSALACRIAPGFVTIAPRGTPFVFPPNNNNSPEQPTAAAPHLNLPTISAGDFIQPTLGPTPVLPTQGPSTLQEKDILVRLFDRVNPGVVLIQVLSDQGGGLGSGFVVDKLGNIVTNFHVVDGATNDQVEVDFPSGFKVMGKVSATDLDSDLAVVKVDAPADQLSPLTLGDSDKVQVGQPVVAIGNPFGLSSTMTTGIVSAKGRVLESIRQSSDGRNFSAGDLIQTDAAINPGNSGGPLLTYEGEVVGINRAIRTAGTTPTGDPVNTGIGFAVPINMVKRVLPTLIQGKSYDYPYLGLSSQENLSLVARKLLGLNRTTGAYVSEVVPGGPSDKAGIQAGSKPTSITGLQSGGDLIIAVDGRPVLVFGDVISYMLENKSPGDKMVFTIVRDNQEKEVTITLGKRP